MAICCQWVIPPDPATSTNHPWSPKDMSWATMGLCLSAVHTRSGSTARPTCRSRYSHWGAQQYMYRAKCYGCQIAWRLLYCLITSILLYDLTVYIHEHYIITVLYTSLKSEIYMNKRPILVTNVILFHQPHGSLFSGVVANVRHKLCNAILSRNCHPGLVCTYMPLEPGHRVATFSGPENTYYYKASIYIEKHKKKHTNAARGDLRLTMFILTSTFGTMSNLTSPLDSLYRISYWWSIHLECSAYLAQISCYRWFKNDNVLFDLDLWIMVKVDITNEFFT